MARITLDLVRKRAEHNNCEVSTLEELSLHQQDLIKIEHLDRWCRGLKILYLQNNLIGRIENVGRLKQLQYLNLALNNIEIVENLQNCEFLEKLDLTLNFVGELLSVESLSANVHLRELYLTGNPCTDYEDYRNYVVAVLPQLNSLDGTEVTKSERILACQRIDSIQTGILSQQEKHKEKRAKEKAEHEQRQAKKNEKKPGFDGRWYTDADAHVAKDGGDEEPANDDEFWEENVPYTPESRTETLLHISESKKEKPKEASGPKQVKRVRKLEMDGKMLNVNEGRYEFHLTEGADDSYLLLDVAVPRFMDTSLVDCDVQPSYVRVTIKGKILQLVLSEEVSPDKSTAQRSQTTGHLLVTMPKADHIIRRTTPQTHSFNKIGKPPQTTTESSVSKVDSEKRENGFSQSNKTQLLEVDPSVKRSADFANIVKNKDSSPPTVTNTPTKGVTEDRVSEDFVDDPDVPPLI